MAMTRSLRLSLILLLAVLASGCEALLGEYWSPQQRTGASSSVVEFLYPDGAVPPKPTGELPVLPQPLTVGLAFVPGRDGEMGPLSEPQKLALLETVRAKFAGEDYVTQIVLVPEAYLRGADGFTALERAARMYGLDVMALVSYDQLSTSSDKQSSFLYWTIVGAYLVEGTRNDVQTLVDTAVFDIPSRTLLFRAAGTDRVQKDATMVASPQQMRQAQVESFERAMRDMTTNLQVELDAFKVRVKEGKAPVRVAQRTEGGGAAGALPLVGLLVLGLRRRYRPAARS
jgi:rhombotail lipoprotein